MHGLWKGTAALGFAAALLAGTVGCGTTGAPGKPAGGTSSSKMGGTGKTGGAGKTGGTAKHGGKAAKQAPSHHPGSRAQSSSGKGMPHRGPAKGHHGGMGSSGGAKGGKG
jgi:extracellular elastinolytic metalloproteinase